MIHKTGKQQFIVALFVVSFAALLGGSLALIVPVPRQQQQQQQQQQYHPSPSTSAVRAYRYTPAEVTIATRVTQLGGSAFVSRPPSSSALQLGFNNNNNGGGGAGGADLDPGLKLLVCILIDFIGVASFAAPGLGEATDVGWAPISALLVNYLFGNGIFTALALVEELAPGLDFVPTATIAWFFENSNANNKVQEEQPAADFPPPAQSSPPPRSGSSSRPPADSNVIDVDVIE